MNPMEKIMETMLSDALCATLTPLYILLPTIAVLSALLLTVASLLAGIARRVR